MARQGSKKRHQARMKRQGKRGRLKKTTNQRRAIARRQQRKKGAA